MIAGFLSYIFGWRCMNLKKNGKFDLKPLLQWFRTCSTRGGSIIFSFKFHLLSEYLPLWYPTAKTISAECFLVMLFFCFRFGPYFVEPVIAGLGPDNKPFISGTDIIGAPLFAKDFVVAGTCSEQLFGMCESLFKPDMVRSWMFFVLPLIRSSVDWKLHIFLPACFLLSFLALFFVLSSSFVLLMSLSSSLIFAYFAFCFSFRSRNSCLRLSLSVYWQLWIVIVLQAGEQLCISCKRRWWRGGEEDSEQWRDQRIARKGIVVACLFSGDSSVTFCSFLCLCALMMIGQIFKHYQKEKRGVSHSCRHPLFLPEKHLSNTTHPFFLLCCFLWPWISASLVASTWPFSLFSLFTAFCFQHTLRRHYPTTQIASGLRGQLSNKARASSSRSFETSSSLDLADFPLVILSCLCVIFQNYSKHNFCGKRESKESKAGDCMSSSYPLLFVIPCVLFWCSFIFSLCLWVRFPHHFSLVQ